MHPPVHRTGGEETGNAFVGAEQGKPDRRMIVRRSKSLKSRTDLIPALKTDYLKNRRERARACRAAGASFIKRGELLDSFFIPIVVDDSILR